MDQSEIIFDALDLEGTNSVTAAQLIDCFVKRGITLNDPRISGIAQKLSRMPLTHAMTKQEFVDLTARDSAFLDHVTRNDLIIPDFNLFGNHIEEIFHKVKENKEGKVATYIPQLAKMDPDKFAVSICTIDGQVLHLGDHEDMVCIQSTSKPLNYCLALEEHGLDKVHQHVGHEPSGRKFNELTLNKDGLPHNPLINAGAIMSSSLIRPNHPTADRFEHVLSTWKKACNSKNVGFNNSVYLSEKESADRNFALAYFMRENGAFPEGTDINKTLEFYFQCCSIETNNQSISTLAATFANGGVCPFTNEKVFESSTIKYCLSLMYSCGMYDYSGEFGFHIGLPAKSGVSGVVYLIVPNTLGISIWSPRLDENGNSVRAIEFCKELTKKFLLHNYDSLVTDQVGKINPRCDVEQEDQRMVQELCAASSHGDVKYMQTLLVRGAKVNQADYDLRTPLHLGVCEQRIESVRYLVGKGANIHFKDRWGRSPLDEAIQLENQEIVRVLQESEQGKQGSSL